MRRLGPILLAALILSNPTVALAVKWCSNCGIEVPENATRGDHCPHCGVMWADVISSEGRPAPLTERQIEINRKWQERKERFEKAGEVFDRIWRTILCSLLILAGLVLLVGLADAMTRCANCGKRSVSAFRRFCLCQNCYDRECQNAEKLVAALKHPSAPIRDAALEEIRQMKGAHVLAVLKAVLKKCADGQKEEGVRAIIARAVNEIEVRESTTEQCAASDGDSATSVFPEDSVIGALLAKVKQAGRRLYFGRIDGCEVFSDGVFMEIAPELPSAVQKMKDVSTLSLPEYQLRACIPQDWKESGKEVTTTELNEDTIVLHAAGSRVVVNKVYFDYLRLRHPESKVFCLGENRPVVFIDGGRPCGILMPIKQK